MKRSVLLLFVAAALAAFAQDSSKTTTTTTTTKSDEAYKEVPVLDAELGPCSAEFHVVDTNGKNVYDAKIKTLIKSRAFGLKKSDLQVSTNYEGRAKFTGLPDVNKRPTTFEILKDGKRNVQPFDPGANCHPVFEVTLGKDFVMDSDKK